jgi:cytoskeletal protein RodZ
MAAAGFRTRRIISETSIGDRLKKARTRRKISVTEVEEATRIRSKFILALESDSWEHIPSEVYGRGYLETYAAFLKLPVDDVMRDYDRQRSLYARRCQQGVPEFAPKESLRLPKIVLTSRSLVMTGLAIAILVFGGIITKQVTHYALSPYLTVHAAGLDGGPQLIVSADSVTLNGSTVSDAIVSVNNDPVKVSGDGSFTAQVKLQKGVNAVNVTAERNGKTTNQVISVVSK